LDVLRRAGFSPAEATQIARQAVRSVTALVAARPLFSAGTGQRDRTRRFLEALPADRYPRIVEAAAPLSGCDDPETHHRLGLELVLAGIEEIAARSKSLKIARRV
jgi:hypothetical protein